MPAMATPAQTGFGAFDWTILGCYFIVLAVTGWVFSRREPITTDDYFLGGRRMPTWAVGVSIVATSMSAASFIGVPEQGYTSDLTYLSTNIGMVLAALVVAYLFMPAFYRRRVRTVYELMGQRFGPGAMHATSGAYMVGRIMASGVRVYIGAIPAALILFGPEGLSPANLCLAITVLTGVGIVYTLAGGIASVIWTDVIQMGVLLGACLLAIVLIARQLPADAGAVASAITHADARPWGKLTLFAFSDESRPWWENAFSLPAVLVGFTLMGIASYGTDQDMTQRMLTCRDERAAARSVIGGILFGIPSVALFLAVGLLLWVYYQQPALWTAHGLEPPPAPATSKEVFLRFILDHMPAGLRGLMMAGLFAAGLSSLNSGVNAMASTFINDFYRGWTPDRPERHYLAAGRWAVVAWGLILGGFAMLCVFWQYHDGQLRDKSTLLTFALSVMTFAYAGLVPVFLTALLTRRGSTAGVIAALAVGFLAVLAMQPITLDPLLDLTGMRKRFDAARLLDPLAAKPLALGVVDLAFVWKLTIASALAMVVCLLPRGRAVATPAPDA